MKPGFALEICCLILLMFDDLFNDFLEGLFLDPANKAAYRLAPFGRCSC